MKTVRYLDEELVIKKGVKVLIRELGPVEGIRLINLPKRSRSPLEASAVAIERIKI